MKTKVITKEQLKNFMRIISDEKELTDIEFKAMSCALECLFDEMYSECAHELNVERDNN